MIENKKGLSTIIGTLLIILLVIVAVGIIWVVIRGTLQSGVEELDIGAKCLEVSVMATAVTCTVGTPNACAVTLYREAGGDAIDGVKIVISDGLTSVVHEEAGNIEQLGTTTVGTIDISDVAIANVESVEVAAYFDNAAGEAQVCSGTHTFVDIGLP